MAAPCRLGGCCGEASLLSQFKVSDEGIPHFHRLRLGFAKFFQDCSPRQYWPSRQHFTIISWEPSRLLFGSSSACQCELIWQVPASCSRGFAQCLRIAAAIASSTPSSLTLTHLDTSGKRSKGPPPSQRPGDRRRRFDILVASCPTLNFIPVDFSIEWVSQLSAVFLTELRQSLALTCEAFRALRLSVFLGRP